MKATYRKAVPRDLTSRRQWVVWRYERRNGEKTKPPFIARENAGHASSTDPSTWVGFEEALRFHHADSRTEGIGYVTTEDDGIVGIDIDHCRDPKTGHTEQWAKDIVLELDSYTEVTPSQSGLRVYVKGKLPAKRHKQAFESGAVEMYETSRYFTVTGWHVSNDTPATINERQDELISVYRRVYPGPLKKPKKSKPQKTAKKLTDEEIIERACNAKNGEKFSLLWEGKWEDVVREDGSRYPTQSEADLALVAMLAFWTNGDAERMNELFEESGLYRDKWDERHYGDGRTYGEGTIEKVLDEWDGEGYTPELEKSDNGKKPDFTWTDLGNARRLVERHGKDLQYCYPWRCWMVWDGQRWVKDETGEIRRRAKETMQALRKEAGAAGNAKLQKFATSSLSLHRRKAMIETAQSEPGIPIAPQNLDTDTHLLNCRNGTLDLRTGKLREHRREDFITKMVPVDYDSQATCPLWDAFLERIMAGNKNLIRFLQRAIGYSLTGDISEQVLFLFYGTGANGKSTFLETIRFVLGDYSNSTEFSTFLERRNDAIRNDVAMLVGARFVTATEVGQGRRLDEALVKQMTGRDTITARFLYGEFFHFMPMLKVFLAANRKPTIRGAEHAIWRRIRLVPFTVEIPEKERDKHLLDKLCKEVAGILRWAVEGCLDWQKHGLRAPVEVTEATTEYRQEMDALADFFADRVLKVPGGRTPVGELYKAYEKWCESNSQDPVKKKTFGTMMKERGHEQGRGGTLGRYWKGIMLTEPSHEEEEKTVDIGEDLEKL